MLLQQKSIFNVGSPTEGRVRRAKPQSHYLNERVYGDAIRSQCPFLAVAAAKKLDAATTYTLTLMAVRAGGTQANKNKIIK